MEKNAAQEIVISTFGERSDTRYFEREFPATSKTTLPWEPTPRFRGVVIDKKRFGYTKRRVRRSIRPEASLRLEGGGCLTEKITAATP